MPLRVSWPTSWRRVTAGNCRAKRFTLVLAHIGDTCLLDFMLKSFNNCTLDYCDGEAATKTRKSESGDHPQNQIQVGRSEFERDLEYVYRRVREGGLGGEVVEAARRMVLDTKHLAKEWPIRDDDGKLRFMVSVVVAEEEAGIFSCATPPPELVVLPLHASVGDLRAKPERILCDTYCVMEGFVAQDLIWAQGLKVSEMELLFHMAQLGMGMGVWVRGKQAEWGAACLRYEGGAEERRVECTCGERDDDGERMVACDLCEVWQHTWCLGIPDVEEVAHLLFCDRCASALLPPDMLAHELLIV
ncbi:hypothetical protein AMTR_s00043p00048200 [Amborella trichopoda]|uniref:Zinc finger PHD-type domain-containing protein n=1 Tax=Amborella trichopoda TaxID=13333 RepID=W1PXL5_AMBTC|nr:hypothetical protein AMTR_s00043p00048200 [Amborella trichopoda]